MSFLSTFFKKDQKFFFVMFFMLFCLISLLGSIFFYVDSVLAVEMAAKKALDIKLEELDTLYTQRRIIVDHQLELNAKIAAQLKVYNDTWGFFSSPSFWACCGFVFVVVGIAGVIYFNYDAGLLVQNTAKLTKVTVIKGNEAIGNLVVHTDRHVGHLNNITMNALIENLNKQSVELAILNAKIDYILASLPPGVGT